MSVSPIPNKGKPGSAGYVAAVGRGENRVRKNFKKKADALRWEAETLVQMQTGTFRRGGDQITVSEHLQEYLKWCDQRVKRKEITRSYCKTIRGHVNNYLCGKKGKANHKYSTPFEEGVGRLKLTKLTHGAVQRLKDALLDSGCSVVQTRAVLTTLHSALEYARKQDLILSNPAARVVVRGPRNEKAKKVFVPSRSVMETLIAIADQPLKFRLQFAAATAIRVGEQNALRYRNVNEVTKKLSVDCRVDQWLDVDDQGTKSAAGNREIPLPSAIMSALREHRSRAERNGDDDLIFPAVRGGYQRHNQFRARRWEPLFKHWTELHAAEPDRYPAPAEYFKWHTLRHFGISVWISEGLKPKTIQTWAGHSSLHMTLDVYGHMFPDDYDQETVERIGTRLVGDAGGGG